MQINSFFPLAVGSAQLSRVLSGEEMDFVLAAEKKKNTHNFTSVDTRVLEHKEMLRLKKELEEKLNEYFIEVYRPKTDVKMRITQSWFNYTRRKESHHAHSHSNSLISGVFYLKSEETDKITFYNPNFFTSTIKIAPKEYNPYNSVDWWYPTPKNGVLLFPSTLQHSVPPVETDDIRISLAFNSFPVGNIGEDAELTALTLT